MKNKKILVLAACKAGWLYLIVHIQKAGSRTVYWQATGIRADLVEQTRRRVLAALYEEVRCEAQCEAWGIDYGQ